MLPVNRVRCAFLQRKNADGELYTYCTMSKESSDFTWWNEANSLPSSCYWQYAKDLSVLGETSVPVALWSASVWNLW